MGGNGTFLVSGGFSRQEYFTKDIIEDIKVVKHDSKNNAGLPQYSNTPNTAYLHESADGKINEIRFYKNRMPRFDIDWGHSHGKYPEGIPHIHFWKLNKNGKFERQPPRLLKPREQRLFDKFIQKNQKGA